MICHICKNNVYRVYKIVKGKRIYECLRCNLGLINPADNFQSINRSKIITGLYNFEEYQKIEGKLRKWFERLTDEAVKYKKSGNVLDIGAGYGLFSTILQRKGNFVTDLLEPEQKIKYNLKINKFYKSSFENFNSRDKYDIIVMMDVIEHFADPLKNLKKIKNLLNDDGILIIQTPNYRSLMAKICRDWAWWMIEDHKFFFSPKSLGKILNKSGFKMDFLMTYEDQYDFKKNLDGNFSLIKDNFIRKANKVLVYFIFFPFYYLFKNIIWNSGKGGLLFVIAQNKNV